MATALLIAWLYLLASGALVFANAAVWRTLEFPWVWYWALWSVLFSPPIGFIMFAAASRREKKTPIRLIDAVGLFLVLVAMEFSLSLDLGLKSAILVLFLISACIYWLFRRVD